MLTVFRIPVAVHTSGPTLQCWCHVEGLTAEERMDDVHANTPALDRGRHGTSEPEHSVFAGGVHRGAGDTAPRRLEVGV